ncbi:phosphate-starvation-inducible PsiE family protein [Roseospira marina]|uniref:Protein PsiE n=1 Tax=Roseospira marina TaxID=140057 RepID=A0A5M6ICQ4_9PROT|nr:phosphate-starvation-inducible PsiE family protein [Roseospira marina]KAA5605983.1 phosphate-starvation-inducible PsiE family protein [Roseospira marina]MBB4313167.1 phosphate starvation-inducible membrane PsiE [Roseospira marina]MBB5086092.1 phosphate starvation-inducible membrane PsiE [Roseospira marina]
MTPLRLTPTSLIGTAERILLGLVVLMTIAAVGLEIWSVVQSRTVVLADILLLFLYAEVLSMVKVYYARERAAFLYPILIAMTALSRLIVLQSKEMDPRTIFFEATAILILAVGLVLMRSPVLRGLVDRGLGDRPTGQPTMRDGDAETEEASADGTADIDPATGPVKHK